MPIDPSIPYRVLEQRRGPSVLERYSQVMGIKNAMRGAKLQEQQAEWEQKKAQAQIAADQSLEAGRLAAIARDDMKAALEIEEKQTRMAAEMFANLDPADERGWQSTIAEANNRGWLAGEYANAAINATPEQRGVAIERFRKITLGEKAYQPTELSEGATLAGRTATGGYERVYTAPKKQPDRSMSQAEIDKERYDSAYKMYLEENGLPANARSQAKFNREVWPTLRESKLLTKEEEEQQMRINQSKSKEDVGGLTQARALQIRDDIFAQAKSEVENTGNPGPRYGMTVDSAMSDIAQKEWGMDIREITKIATGGKSANDTGGETTVRFYKGKAYEKDRKTGEWVLREQ